MPLDWDTSNQKAKKGGHGACAEVYPGKPGPALPAADKGGISPGTKDRIKEEQAIPGDPFSGPGTGSGTEAD